MELIALQAFFAFMILIISGAIAYEVVQILASFWDPIVDAWNGPRPKPKWRWRGSQRTNTPPSATQSPTGEKPHRPSTPNRPHKPSSSTGDGSLIKRLSQNTRRPDR